MAHSLPPPRPLGRTGWLASRLGIGDAADPALPFDRLVGVLRRALDHGLNVIDTAPGYADGLSERLVGAAIRDRRDRVFLIDKIDEFPGCAGQGNPRRPVLPQIEDSLRRLGTDRIDLMVFHGVNDMASWQAVTRPAGPFEELLKVRDSGKVRFVGVSAHHPDVVRDAVEEGLCDVVMFPAGPFVERRYVEESLPLARQAKVGTVCFKTFAAGRYAHPANCVRYTLTLDPDVALLGMSLEGEVDAAVEAARGFKPMCMDERLAVRSHAEETLRPQGRMGWDPPRA